MRIVVIHWKPGEGAALTEELRSRRTPSSHGDHGEIDVEVVAPKGSAEIKQIRPDVDVFVIDLSRMPLQGRAVAIELRKRAGTRAVPIVFAGGTKEKVEAVRRLLPDAAYLEWSEIPNELERVVREAPKKPVVPDTMAGYSGTPLAKKLGIKAGSTVALVGAPDGFEAKLEPLDETVRVVKKAQDAERAIVFISAMKTLERQWAATVNAVAGGATVWIAWPKKASGIVTDVTENAVRAYGLARGWVDYKICAIDETWSGLAFAKRKA